MEKLNEKFTKESDPIEDMGIGKKKWLHKIWDALFDYFEADDSVDLFMDIAKEELDYLFSKGTSPKKAADLILDDKDFMDEWEERINKNSQEPMDDLKANCRSWETGDCCDKESVEELASYLIDRRTHHTTKKS